MKMDLSVQGQIRIILTREEVEDLGYPFDELYHDLEQTMDLFEDLMAVHIEIPNHIIAPNEHFLMSRHIDSTALTYYMLLPHTSSKAPYILKGVEYELPDNPQPYMLKPDEEYLGGLCECLCCNEAREMARHQGKHYATSATQDEMNEAYGYNNEEHSAQASATATSTPPPETYSSPVFAFGDFEHVIATAHRTDHLLISSSLYQYENVYYLIYNNIPDWGSKQANLISIVAEHGGMESKRTEAYLQEYGKQIIKDTATSTLKHHFTHRPNETKAD